MRATFLLLGETTSAIDVRKQLHQTKQITIYSDMGENASIAGKAWPRFSKKSNWKI